jgi:hypothetical protein
VTTVLQYVLVVCALVCPVSMAAMLLMMRSGKQRRKEE